MKDFEFEFIDEAVSIQRRGKYNVVVQDWLKSNSKTLKFKFPNELKARNCYSAVSGIRKKCNLDYTIYRRQCEVYLVRA